MKENTGRKERKQEAESTVGKSRGGVEVQMMLRKDKVTRGEGEK